MLRGGAVNDDETVSGGNFWPSFESPVRANEVSLEKEMLLPQEKLPRALRLNFVKIVEGSPASPLAIMILKA